jgi:hypothetical protein
MANMAETVARFEREGVFPASMALVVTRLRQTAPELVPRSAKGGGAMSPQVEPRHLTNIILGMGAHSPINAAAAVAALRPLPWTAVETLIAPTSVPHKGAYQDFQAWEGDQLGDVLDWWVNAAAEPSIRAAMTEVAGHEWTLTLCPDGPYATFSQRVRNEVQTAVWGDRSFTDRAVRLVAMPFRVFMIAGELWQDTRERRETAERKSKERD